MSTGLGSSRRRERVLLGLDQAFASSSSSIKSSGNAAAAARRAGGTGEAGAGGGQAGGRKPASNDAALYTELPAQIVTSTTMEAACDKPTPPPTVESALQDLLLRNTRDLQLKGKTVTLDNTRGQNEQQRKEARLRRQLLRGRTRFSVSIAKEEGGGRGAAGVEDKEAGDDDGGMASKKKKTRRQVATYQDYMALEGAWQGYMQQLLGVRTEEDEEEEGEERRKGEDNNKPEARSSNAKTAFYSKKSAERNVAGADMPGARVRVVASKCPSEVGLEGVVLRESRGAFHILPISDVVGKQRRRVKIVPKAGRRFQATVEGGRGGRAGGREGQRKKKKKLTLILHGNGLMDRGRAIASRLIMRRDKAGGGGEAGRLLKTTHLV